MSNCTGERIRKGDTGLIPGYVENVKRKIEPKRKKNAADRIALRRAEELRKQGGN